MNSNAFFYIPLSIYSVFLYYSYNSILYFGFVSASLVLIVIRELDNNYSLTINYSSVDCQSSTLLIVAYIAEQNSVASPRLASDDRSNQQVHSSREMLNGDKEEACFA